MSAGNKRGNQVVEWPGHIRHPPVASVLARFSLPAWSSVRAWLLRLRTVFDFAPAILPAADPVLHMLWPMPAWV